MRVEKPKWRIPHNLQALLDADEDLTWDTDDWLPVQLTVMGGTTYNGRDINQSWQIDFEPDGLEFEEPNQKLAQMGLDPDGYGWGTLIHEVIKKYHPEMADEVHFGDCEESTCVVWVESELTCRKLMDIVWMLIFESE